MRVYWMRHGETDWNRIGKIQGCTDIPLNDRGREQAREAARLLRGTEFDAAWCSPLSRAQETARLVLEGRGLEPRVDARLREVNFGPNDGRLMAPDRADPASPLYLWFADPDAFVPPPGAESHLQALARAEEFFRVVLMPLQHTCRNVFVATHGSLTRILVTVLMGRPAGEFQKLALANCSVTEIEVKDDAVRLLRAGTTRA